MLLDKSKKSLAVVLLGAKTTNDCDWSAVIRDVKREVIVPGILFLGRSDGVLTITAVPSPEDNVAREIQEFIFCNTDTAMVTVLVQYVADGVYYTMKQTTLNAGQTLHYSSGYGWMVI